MGKMKFLDMNPNNHEETKIEEVTISEKDEKLIFHRLQEVEEGTKRAWVVPTIMHVEHKDRRVRNLLLVWGKQRRLMVEDLRVLHEDMLSLRKNNDVKNDLLVKNLQIDHDKNQQILNAKLSEIEDKIDDMAERVEALNTLPAQEKIVEIKSYVMDKKIMAIMITLFVINLIVALTR